MTRGTVLTSQYVENRGEIYNFIPTRNMLENYITKSQPDDDSVKKKEAEKFTIFRGFDICTNYLKKCSEDANAFQKHESRPRLNKLINLADFNYPNVVDKIPSKPKEIIVNDHDSSDYSTNLSSLMKLNEK